jgi:hypothetical protein
MELNVYVEWADTNISAHIGEVPGLIMAFKDVKTLHAQIRDVLEFHLEGCLDAGDADAAAAAAAGWIADRNWEFAYHYSIPALLNLYDGILNRSSLARIAGINASLMRQYLGGYRNPSKKQLLKIQKNIHTFASGLSAVRIS